MADPIDAELLGLLNKLNKLQQQVGGGKEKQSIIGEDGKIDRFLDLRHTMQERLDDIRVTLETIKTLESSGGNSRDLIVSQSKVRSELTKLNDEWNELHNLYNHEAKKKRSKFTKDDLEMRQQMLVKLQREIKQIRDSQRSGYVQGYGSKDLVAMEDSELFKKPDASAGGGSSGGGNSSEGGRTGGRNQNMTEEHRAALYVIKERDHQLDIEITEIGKGVDTLMGIARAQNEEIKVQNRMLDVLETKIDDVHEHVTNINQRLKVTLEEARKSDKICMDILCLIILVGMIIAVIKLNTQNKKSEESA